jgi:hypothetical protein
MVIIQTMIFVIENVLKHREIGRLNEKQPDNLDIRWNTGYEKLKMGGYRLLF